MHKNYFIVFAPAYSNMKEAKKRAKELSEETGYEFYAIMVKTK